MFWFDRFYKLVYSTFLVLLDHTVGIAAPLGCFVMSRFNVINTSPALDPDQLQALRVWVESASLNRSFSDESFNQLLDELDSLPIPAMEDLVDVLESLKLSDWVRLTIASELGPKAVASQWFDKLSALVEAKLRGQGIEQLADLAS